MTPPDDKFLRTSEAVRKALDNIEGLHVVRIDTGDDALPAPMTVWDPAIKHSAVPHREIPRTVSEADLVDGLLDFWPGFNAGGAGATSLGMYGSVWAHVEVDPGAGWLTHFWQSVRAHEFVWLAPDGHGIIVTEEECVYYLYHVVVARAADGWTVELARA